MRTKSPATSRFCCSGTVENKNNHFWRENIQIRTYEYDRTLSASKILWQKITLENKIYSRDKGHSSENRYEY